MIIREGIKKNKASIEKQERLKKKVFLMENAEEKLKNSLN